MRAVVIAVLAACSRAPAPALPTIGAWQHITGNPDLGALTGPAQQPVDFAIWQAADGTWHIWECIRFTLVGGNTRLFYHFAAASPFGPWTPEGIAMTADPSVGEVAGGLQAPYVFRDGSTYRMFYGTWEAICAQTSRDGVAFTRVLDGNGQCPLFSEGPMSNTRDPMILPIGDTWYAYYTAATADATASGGFTGRVYARTSRDLATWSDPVVVSYGGIAGNDGTSTECPFVVARKSGYYLLRTQVYGATPQSTVYASNDPLDFGVDDDRFRLGTLSVAAPEIFEVDGRTYIAALELGLDGIRIAPIDFPE